MNKLCLVFFVVVFLLLSLCLRAFVLKVGSICGYYIMLTYYSERCTLTEMQWSLSELNISQVWNAKLLFTRLFSPLPPQTRQFGKCDFSSPRAVRAAGTVVAPNLWMWHIDWEIYSLQTTLVFPVDSPQVSALSSHRSHSSSRTMCENIWEEKKKIVFEKCVFLCVSGCFYFMFFVG